MTAPGGPVLISHPNEDGGSQLLGSTISVTALALIVVVLRLYVRVGKIRSFGLDDGFMTFALALSLSGQGVVIAQVFNGAGRHIGDVPPDRYSVGLKLNFITQPIYLYAICFVKLAVGATLVRIAVTKSWKRTILSIMIFMTVYTVASFFTIIFQCTDIRIMWDPTIRSVCWSKETLQALGYTNTVINILTDILFAVVIPTPMLWNLNVNRRTRYTLIAILGLGLFGCAASIIKLGYLVNYGKLGDWLWDSRNITIWNIVECNTGIIAGSLPCLRPLFRSFFGSIYGKGSARANSKKIFSSTSGKQWNSAASGNRRGGPYDDTSSERALNTGVGAYELEVVGKSGLVGVTTFTVDGKSSDESLSGIGDQAVQRGIQKTVTTTMTYSK
ncbi:hypothetical protein F5Y19DRAFT_456404 [Xylariaceae sp. FL1651]|nr:hypothetical protein F5Y19DRAFT_456404 [Xylariaceae sp. FL1651]